MELLERHFDTAFDALDGVKKLRELILTLAMQGKLVPQDPNDPPASELFRQIETERKRLVKQGKIKEPKPLPPVSAEETPYALPKGWEWARLGSLTEVIRGVTYSKTQARESYFESSIELLRANNIQQAIIFDDTLYLPESLVSDSQILQLGDILIAMSSGSPHLVGKAAQFLADRRCTFGAFCAVIRPFAAFLFDFVYKYCQTPLYRGQTQEAGKGIGIQNLNKEVLQSLFLPLPPLLEQRRIIDKVDELMVRCDALEKLRGERDAKRLAMHSAAVYQLLNVADTDGHTHARDFLGQNFGELYTVKENVTELRKAILQLAVMGKLVPQDPKDPPASELLKEIEAEKKRLVKIGKIKEPKPMDPVLNGEVPFQIPESWDWVRLGDCGNSQTGTTPPSNNQSYYGDHIPFIGPGDITDGSIDYSGKGLSRSGMSVARVIDADSLLMVCIGGSIGKLAINTQTVTCNQQINTLTPYKPLPIRFLYWFAAAPWFQSAVLNASGGSATPIINKQRWSSIVTPLPPLSEQHRIVAKIDQLMSLCDTLEQQIDAARKTQSAMLNAMMEQYGEQRCA